MEYAELERWYDRYLAGGQHIHNPKSIAKSMEIIHNETTSLLKYNNEK